MCKLMRLTGGWTKAIERRVREHQKSTELSSDPKNGGEKGTQVPKEKAEPKAQK